MFWNVDECGESIPVCLTLVPETFGVGFWCPRGVGVIPSVGRGCPYYRDQDRELSQAWGQRWAAGGELRLGGGEGTSLPTPSPLPNPS